MGNYKIFDCLKLVQVVLEQNLSDLIHPGPTGLINLILNFGVRKGRFDEGIEMFDFTDESLGEVSLGLFLEDGYVV